MNKYNSKSMRNRPIRVMIFGDTGTGKTTLACSFPRPVFVMAAGRQGGDPTLRHHDVDVLEVESDADMALALAELRKNEGKWDTVVIDTVTHLAGCGIEVLTGNSGKTVMDDFKAMRQPDWGKLEMFFLKSLHPNLTALSMHVVYLALEKEVWGTELDRKGNAISVLESIEPAIPGGTRTQLPAGCDVVGRLTVGPDGSRRLQVKRGGASKAIVRTCDEAAFPIEIPATFDEITKRLPWVVRNPSSAPNNGAKNETGKVPASVNQPA